MAQHDLTLGGYHVPKGTMVATVSQISARDERFFHTPDKFLPERWDRNQRGGNFHPYASMPFGHGPRSCVGKRIAQGEVNVLIIKILQKYRLEYDGEEIDVETGIVAKTDRKPNYTSLNYYTIILGW